VMMLNFDDVKENACMYFCRDELKDELRREGRGNGRNHL
jgi:hypothetical protein